MYELFSLLLILSLPIAVLLAKREKKPKKTMVSKEDSVSSFLKVVKRELGKEAYERLKKNRKRV